MTSSIFHLALLDEWDDAVARGGPYERSTIGASLRDVGFIHCSYEHQVPATAERFYGGRSDVVVLRIDADRVASELRDEAADGSAEVFPHLYAPLQLDAVVSVEPLRVAPR
jgi:glutathione S-transferase